MSGSAPVESLRELIKRFDNACIQVFQGAANLCVSRGHYEVGTEHFVLRMLDDTAGDVTRILAAFKADRARLRRAVLSVLDSFPTGHTGKPAVSAKLTELFGAAGVLSDELGLDQIRPGLVLLALVLNPGHSRISEATPELERIDADHLRDHFMEIVSPGQGAGAGAGEAARPPSEAGAGGALEQYTVDLTAKAAAGQIDPVFGRDHEIRQMIDIFARRRKNNPILVGEPGTGKTAIVEGLALRISENDVPPNMRGVRLISLDLGLLQAGAGIKGEFENRLKNVIREIKASETPIIVFIDEAHTLIGAGGTAGGSDAANLLKPALARGELRTVAATTWAEYKKYFEKDAALERRFQLVRCEEPSVETAIVILRGLKDRYEEHHKVVVLDEAVTDAARLSNRYISGRFLPDKAVDLLDTASARVSVMLRTTPAVVEDLDRDLQHLETAMSALRRDTAAGILQDDDVLREMEVAKEKKIAERAVLETKWKSELAIVEKIQAARTRLPGFKFGVEHDRGGSAKAGDRGGSRPETKQTPAAAGSDKPAAPPAVEPPASALDTASVSGALSAEEAAKVRQEIDRLLKDLAVVQGESPMLQPQVDASAVAAVVSDWTGIPVRRMAKDDLTSILNLEAGLMRRVVGQDHAMSIIANKLRSSRAGLSNPTQPLGVFFCVGPSGVGKTELALTVSEIIFGGERFTVTINMSEFMEAHTVSQLKGSPPGYVGYGEGGVLTEAVRQRPYSVVLLDEVEKAHPDVLNLFYQVFDKGSLSDGEGREINFKNTVVFMTSNLATDVIQGMCEGGERPTMEALQEAIYPHLRQHFKPALLARMTIVPFFTLGKDILKSITQLKLGKVGARLTAAHRAQWHVEDAVYDSIAGRCTEVDLGARNIDHILDREVLPVLARKLLEEFAQDRQPAKVTMSLDDQGAFKYQFDA